MFEVKADQKQNIRDVVGKLAPQKNKDSVLEEKESFKDTLDDLTKQMAAMTAHLARLDKPRQIPTCQQCGKIGHYTNQCFQTKAGVTKSGLLAVEELEEELALAAQRSSRMNISEIINQTFPYPNQNGNTEQTNYVNNKKNNPIAAAYQDSTMEIDEGIRIDPNTQSRPGHTKELPRYVTTKSAPAKVKSKPKFKGSI
ncbi:hypothetical protein BB561_006451 [Smittium simulii]|uniref:CCHC-type domain-containing protein n=1 Tax=Smittium simulii TaxID=133385 RepID=A0A2T9Y436_9FUNG|nr:hypothetical protein BB561_006451 [Smittium simulii]